MIEIFKDLLIERANLESLRRKCSQLEPSEYDAIGKLLLTDERKGVQNLGKSLLLKMEKYILEEKRMMGMFEFERNARMDGYLRIGGVDEAGRGPLVGPVVAPCVVLDERINWSGIDDSKKLSSEKRTYFYEKIKDEAIAWGVGISNHELIDHINILNATKMAMKEAIHSVKPDYLLIDAVKLSDVALPQKAIIKGDSLSASIAAASIIAKVTRDKWMNALHETYPHYDFLSNKGYGTAAHYEAIKIHGITEYHRKSFLKSVL